MLVLLFLVAVAAPKTYTEKDVKDEGCRVLCIRDGYKDGKSFKKGCACFDLKEDYEDYVGRKLHLGKKVEGGVYFTNSNTE